MKPYLVCTQHRGVFAGLIKDDQDINAKTLPLYQAKMAIYWATTKGVMELANVGPNIRSKISLAADIPALHDVTSVFAISEAAWAKWLEA